MIKAKFLTWAMAFSVVVGASSTLRAADDAAPTPGPNREKGDKKREELKSLTPEERRARMKEWREKRDAMTSEERDALRKELRERFDNRLAELQKRKGAGTMTEAESKELERMEQMKKRFEQFGRPGGPPPKRSNGDKPSAPEKPARDKPPTK